MLRHTSNVAYMTMEWPIQHWIKSTSGLQTTNTQRFNGHFSGNISGRHPYSAGRPSRWALAHISSISCYVQEQWWKCLVILVLALTNPSNDGFRNMGALFHTSVGPGPSPLLPPFLFHFRCLAMPFCVCRYRQSCRNKCKKEPENLLVF